MADTKISNLPAATTPLAGTEVLPIVQSGATKKVSVANLTAGRNVAMLGFDSRDDNLILNPAGGAVASKKLQYGSGALVNAASTYSFTASSTGGYYIVATSKSGTGVMTDAAYVDPTQNFGLYVGNIQFDTAAKGINFTANTPAAGMTSQLLNWYEEGTWTPALSSTGGGETVTYTYHSGAYTRVGNLVYFNLFVKINTVSGGSGNTRLTLPITNKDYPDYMGYPVIIAQISGQSPQLGNVIGAQAYLDVLFNFTTLAAGNEIRITGVYQAA